MTKAYALKHKHYDQLLHVEITSTPFINHQSCTRDAYTSYSLTVEGQLGINPLWLTASSSEARHIANMSHSDDNQSFETPYNPFDGNELEVVEIEINPVSVD